MTKSMDSIFTAKSTEEKLPIVGGKPHSPLKLTDPDYGALIGGPLIDKHQKY